MADYLELVQRLRGVNWVCHTYGKDEIRHDTVCHEAADAIELLQRKLKCANELWEQQKELALEYLADIEKANERIAELEQEIDDYETIYKGSVVEAQSKRIEELKAALRPFAEVADLYLDEAPGNYSIKEYLSRFRAARKVLEIKND